MSTHSLGTFYFIRMDADGQPNGCPPILQKQTAIVTRPGVPGTGVIDMATRGKPFQMRTIVDLSTQLAAEQMRDSYRQQICQDKLNIVRAGIDYGSVFQTEYVVLDVQQAALTRHANAVGGINGGNWLLLCNWVLLPVEP